MADERLLPASIRTDPSAQAYNEMAERIGTIDVTSILVYLVDLVPSAALPALIEQFHVAGNEGANLAENDENRRQLIKSAIALHRLKGTPAAIKQAIAAAGFGAVAISEPVGAVWYDGRKSYAVTFMYDGEVLFNGRKRYDGSDEAFTYNNQWIDWAHYDVIMERPLTNDQAVLIRAICREFAPARSALRSLVYTASAIRYNGQSTCDGTYNYGSA